MIGIDTNVLLRYLTNDDPAQSPRARKLLTSCTPEAPAFISTATFDTKAVAAIPAMSAVP